MHDRMRSPSPIVVVLLSMPLAGVACSQPSRSAKPSVAPPQTTSSSTTKPASRPASAQDSKPGSQPAVPTEKVIIAGEQFNLEIAADGAAREKGLMGRDHIDPHGGMVFIFPIAQTHEFWMKNCPIDIDVIFLDSQ